mgnify:CR=1 FL=1|jgi:hypothetical protein
MEFVCELRTDNFRLRQPFLQGEYRLAGLCRRAPSLVVKILCLVYLVEREDALEVWAAPGESKILG